MVRKDYPARAAELNDLAKRMRKDIFEVLALFAFCGGTFGALIASLLYETPTTLRLTLLGILAGVLVANAILFKRRMLNFAKLHYLIGWQFGHDLNIDNDIDKYRKRSGDYGI